MKIKLIINQTYFSANDAEHISRLSENIDCLASYKGWQEEFSDLNTPKDHDLLVYLGGNKLYDIDFKYLHQHIGSDAVYHLQELTTKQHPDAYISSEVFLCKPGCELSSIKELPYGCIQAASIDDFIKVHQMPRKKALFLDRDGIIIADNNDYPYKPESFRFIHESINVIQYFKNLDFSIYLITNQAGIARGYYTEQDFKVGIEHILQYLKNKEAEVTGYNFCPYHIDGTIDNLAHSSLRRKPAPGMILEILSNNRIDLSNSLMIGDRDSDRIDLIGLKSYIVGDKSKKPDFDDLNDLLSSLKRLQAYE